MVLFMIGIGLNDEQDITMKGLEAVRNSHHIYLEAYTSKLACPVEKLEHFYGKKIILADRDLVENKADQILENAKDNDVCFLVIGDIFGATTHTDLYQRAKKKNIKIQIINNASILNAIGITGLELYKFGKTTSIPFDNENVESPYDVIKANKSLGLHTLLLLDIKSDQDKYMTVREALEFLLNVEKKRGEELLKPDSMVVGCARIGGDFKIKYSKVSELMEFDFGKPLHCLVIPGNLHFMEEEMLENWK